MHFTVRQESLPLKRPFKISRETFVAADVVTVELHQDGLVGRGEAWPAPRYGDNCALAVTQAQSALFALGPQVDIETVQAMAPGAARNAIDCAVWDLNAKQQAKRAWQLAGLGEPVQVVTAYTIVLDEPEVMAEQAREEAGRPLLKLKLGHPDKDLARVAAVRSAAPSARLIVDANEGWTLAQLMEFAPVLADAGVELVEQPLPAAEDHVLVDYASPVALCADESCHSRASLPGLVGKYDFINIKLDKTGGFTEALRLARDARDLGFRLMVGSMNGSSLAMAPATLIGQLCEYVDLDGPLFLKQDRQPGLRFDNSTIEPPAAELWG